ncbi:uncharacterized protein [Erythrolamprus reginae]|uniref:uncharacterized protein n=1 Tax=Erythrolamprus reginae TaxID=121349 RepID=UPI00396CCCE6
MDQDVKGNQGDPSAAVKESQPEGSQAIVKCNLNAEAETFPSNLQDPLNVGHQIYPELCLEKAVKPYAMIDTQSNQSLSRSAFLDLFDIQTKEARYTMSACAGYHRMAGRKTTGYCVESSDGSATFTLSPLPECSKLPGPVSDPDPVPVPTTSAPVPDPVEPGPGPVSDPDLVPVPTASAPVPGPVSDPVPVPTASAPVPDPVEPVPVSLPGPDSDPVPCSCPGCTCSLSCCRTRTHLQTLGTWDLCSKFFPVQKTFAKKIYAIPVTNLVLLKRQIELQD